MRRITLHIGDITTDAEAGAIHWAAGPELLDDQAAAVAITATSQALDGHPVEEARFRLFDRRAFDAFEDALGA